MLKYLDPRFILKYSFLYTSYQYIVGGIRARRLFVQNDVPVKPGARVLDIGCGPGDILNFLPEVTYVGIDLDANYISTARKKYPQHTFYCTGVEALDIENLGNFDLVIATGVVHHLDDKQAFELFDIARKTLKKSGKLITFDGCYIENQNPISKKFLEMDRGNYVRNESAYKELAKKHFKTVNTKIDETYFRIPYTSIIMTCSGE